MTPLEINTPKPSAPGCMTPVSSFIAVVPAVIVNREIVRTRARTGHQYRYPVVMSAMGVHTYIAHRSFDPVSVYIKMLSDGVKQTSCFTATPSAPHQRLGTANESSSRNRLTAHCTVVYRSGANSIGSELTLATWRENQTLEELAACVWLYGPIGNVTTKYLWVAISLSVDGETPPAGMWR